MSYLIPSSEEELKKCIDYLKGQLDYISDKIHNMSPEVKAHGGLWFRNYPTVNLGDNYYVNFEITAKLFRLTPYSNEVKDDIH